MRYLFGLMCVCALGVVPLVGCGDEGGPAPECWVAADCDHDNDCTKRHCTDGECHYTTHEYENKTHPGWRPPAEAKITAGSAAPSC